MPLLKILRDEVSSLKKEIEELRRQRAARELIVIEDNARFKAEQQTVRKQSETIIALKKQLGSVAKQQEAAKEAAAAAKAAAEAVERAACEEVKAVKAECEERLSEMRELCDALQLSFETEAICAEAAIATPADAAEMEAAETAANASTEAEDAPATAQKPRSIRVVYCDTDEEDGSWS